MLLPAVAWSGTAFVYTNNNNDFGQPNTVSAYSVDPDGLLTQLPGSPFLTGGTANGGNGFIAANRIAVCGNFLYASNAFSGDVSGFLIDPSNGNLTAVPGSPFAGGGRTFYGISLAATPDCRFLFAANGDASAIFAFRIGGDGALVQVQGSPFAAASQPDGTVVSPDGRFLAVVLTNLYPGKVAMYRIAGDGALSAVPGSPFSTSAGVGVPTSADINCASSLLFVGEVSATADVFAIAADGAIAPITGSPFPTASANVVVRLGLDDRFLFTSSSSSTVNSLRVETDGGITAVDGSPYPAGLEDSAGVAVNGDGRLLFVSDPLNNRMSAMQIADDGHLTLAQGSPVSTGAAGGLFSLAVFPAKACHPALHFYTLDPCRAIDTRGPDGPLGGPALAAGADRPFTIVGKCGVPATARAISVNVTVTAPTSAGHLLLYPAGAPLPLVSSVNYVPGLTRANNAVVKLSPAGALAVHCGQASGTVHVVVDVNGYFE